MHSHQWAASQVWVLTSEDAAPTTECLAGIAFTDDAIVVGSEGLASYRRQHPERCRAADFIEGRFSLLLKEGERLVAKTDPLGQDVIYAYQSGRFWALSNSFFVLCQVVRKAGKPLTVYRSALLAPFVTTDSLYEQLVSVRTPIEQIQVVPLGYQVVLRRAGGTWSMSRERCRRTPPRPQDYADLLRKCMHDWVSRVRALLEHRAGRVSVDITGGQDSRIILGLLLASGVDLSTLRFRSNKQQTADFAIASDLAKLFKFKVRNSPGRPPSATRAEALRLWKAGNLGVYLPVYLPHHATPPPTLHLHGAGGEALRQSYTRRPQEKLRSLKRALPQPAYVRALSSEFLGSFDAIEVDARDPLAMNEHYLQFRSRFHFGRNWVRQLNSPLVTPLVCSDLLEASRLLSEAQRNARQIAHDLLSLLHPTLATLRFDKPDKAFSAELRACSPFANNREPFRPLVRHLDYYGPDEHSAHSPARENEADREQGTQLLLGQLEELRESALALGIFGPDYVEQARSTLASGSRLVKDGRRAAHVICAGEMARLAAG